MASRALNKSQLDEIDLHSLAKDPLFIDPENGDFRFSQESPAYKMGIIPIDISKIGLLEKAEP